ncbi:MAG: hypothetical protein QN168_05000 [Armatimonadota bacterium]|nr:hypothetical protein [Armatimonadota bacterium]
MDTGQDRLHPAEQEEAVQASKRPGHGTRGYGESVSGAAQAAGRVLNLHGHPA